MLKRGIVLLLLAHETCPLSYSVVWAIIMGYKVIQEKRVLEAGQNK